MPEPNWRKVERFLEDAAKNVQNEANAKALAGERETAQRRDDLAALLRIIAGAIRFGMS